MSMVNNYSLISIIIPALNEEEYIGNCLGSIRDMNLGQEYYEVILSDNGSTDKTIEIAESFKESINLRILVTRGVNVSQLRNIGVANSKGDIVAFVDADCTVHKDWINNAVGYFSDSAIGAVGYGYDTPVECSWVEKTWEMRKKRKLGPAKTLPGGNMIVRRTSFLDVAGFDPGLITNEDFDLCFRLRASGFEIFSDPQIRVFHWGFPKNLRSFYKRELWLGTNVFKVFTSNIMELKNFKAVSLALYYILALICVFTSMFIALVFKNHLYLAASALALIAPPFFLSIRTLKGSKVFSKYLIQLYVLFFVYGIARAVSSVNSNRRRS